VERGVERGAWSDFLSFMQSFAGFSLFGIIWLPHSYWKWIGNDLLELERVTEAIL
jgi:hypothetical protein